MDLNLYHLMILAVTKPSLVSKVNAGSNVQISVLNLHVIDIDLLPWDAVSGL